ncbi:hypothetical protein [Psychrobacter sp. AT9]|uniref:hypothetical protein n=1 Tax=Psychrobacter sp. AT9 TaxID=3242893 RepID=UPI0039A77369
MTIQQLDKSCDKDLAQELADFDWGGDSDVVLSRQDKSITSTFSRPVRIELPVFGDSQAALSSADYWAKRLGQGVRIRSIELTKLSKQVGWKAVIRYQTKGDNDVKR